MSASAHPTATATAYRTHTCGELRVDHVKERVKLAGWVDRLLPAGKGLLLRDGAGVTVVAIAAKVPDDAKAAVATFHQGDVVQIEGVVVALPKPREDLPTGAIAVLPTAAIRLAAAAPAPSGFDTWPRGSAERLALRHLDLRSAALQARLAERARLAQSARTWLAARGFCEVETPVLGRFSHDTEAARGFAVPAVPGQVFGLPCGPRESSLLLAASGFDRAFEVGRSFRRRARYGALEQPEASELSITLAHADEADLRALVEALCRALLADAPEVTLGAAAFPVLDWKDALLRFGSDAPHLGVAPELTAVREALRKSDAPAFAGAAGPDAGAFAIRFAGAAERLDGDALAALAAASTGDRGANVAAFPIEGGYLRGPFAEGVETYVADLCRRAAGDARSGDLLVTACAPLWVEAARAGGRARAAFGRALGVAAPGAGEPVWVASLPLFEPNADGEPTLARSPLARIYSAKPGPIQRRDKGVHASTHAFRLALGGIEVGAGAPWTHDPSHVRAVCRMLGWSGTETERAYGPLLEAMRFGVPPCATFCLDLDRLAAVRTGAASLEEVLAFPKASDGQDGLSGAPSPIEPVLLRELITPF